MSDTAQTTSEQPAKAAPVAPVDFQPSRTDRFLGWFVGANYAPHYTKQDVRDIAHAYGPLTIASAAFAAAGPTLLLNEYWGVNPIIAFFPAAAGIVCLDRSIIRAEAIEKADRWFKKNNSEPYDASLELSRGAKADRFAKQVMNRILPLGFRIGMTATLSVLSGGLILEKIAKNEIDATIRQEVAAANEPLMRIRDGERAAYDKQIADMRKRIDGVRLSLTQVQTASSANIVRSPADEAVYQAAIKQIAIIQDQIKAKQTEINFYQTRANAEAKGSGINGASGIPGCYKRCKDDLIVADSRKRELDQLKRDLSDQNAIIERFSRQDQRVIANNQARIDANSQTAKLTQQDALAKSSDELTGLLNRRTSAFAAFDKRMVKDIRWVELDNQKGPFADMRRMRFYLNNPQTGLDTQVFYRSLQLFIIFAEMSAVLGALYRKPTSAEMIDAAIKAKTEQNIERRVMAELEAIIPMRARLRAMAGTSWDKMGAFYRPDQGPYSNRPGNGPAQ